MSDSFLPPVMVELGGSVEGFLRSLTQATAGLERLAESAKSTGAVVDESLASMTESARVMAASVTESTASMRAATAEVAVGGERAATGLRATAAESEAAGAAMAASGARAEAMGGKLLGLGPVFDKVKKWGALGLAGIGIASVDLASKFQAEMTRLSTAAGAPVKQVNAMKGAVLATADAVGMSGTKMAEALYHPVSAGLDLKASLAAVKYAAEEAKISGANLEDTTYSLSSVMKAFNEPASQAKNTMASLNSIVGQGDMRFQDFNESIKNWAPTAAQMGISINSMGSGLAYLTDRGNSAEVAATRLTMGISMMTTPSAKATSMLKGLGLASTDVKASSSAMETAMKKAGITQNKLAADLKRPDGLYVALNDLKTSLEKAGVSGTEADSVLSKIFGGGRSDKAIMSLMQNLDGLRTKFEDIQKASNTKSFDAAWAKTQQTFSAQMSKLKAAAENAGIGIGTGLLPSVTAFVSSLAKAVAVIGPFVAQHRQLVSLVASVAGGLLAGAVALKMWAVAQAAVNALMAVFDAEADANPIGAIVMAIAALVAGLIWAYNHFKAFRQVVNEVGQFLAGQFKMAWKIAADVVHWFATTVLPPLKTAFAAVVSWFRGHQAQFVALWRAMVSSIHDAVTWFNTNVLVWVKARIADLTAWWRQHGAQITAIAKVTFAAVGAAVVVWWNTIMKPTLVALATMWKSTWSVLGATVRTAWALISGVSTTAMHLILNTVGLVLDLITGKWSRVWGDLKRLVGQQLHDVASTIMSVGAGFSNLLYNAGAGVIHGLISGIESAMGGLGSTLSSITSFITSHKGPPEYDRVMLHPAGRMIMQGLMDGLNSRLGDLAAATTGVGQTLQDAFARELGIASPSKKFRTLGAYVMHGLVSGLTGSTARVRAATEHIARSLYVDFGSHHRALQHAVARDNSELMSLARHRDSVATRLKAAQKRLATLQKEWTSERNSVAQGIMQSASIITTAPQEGFALTAQDVVNNMRDQVGKAMQFAAELQTLRKKGLSSDLVAQIAAAGVDQGGATAAALAGASKGTLKQLNQLQGSMKSAANSTGAAVADSMYGSGIKAAQGLVKGLQSQEKAIERQMMRIAESMQRAIKHALGIRSPSRVFQEIGTWIPKGLAKGVDDGARHATAAAHRLAGSVAGAGVRGGLAMAGRGGETVVNNTLYVTVEGHVLTERKLRDVVEKEMLRLGMRNPQTYASYKR